MVSQARADAQAAVKPQAICAKRSLVSLTLPYGVFVLPTAIDLMYRSVSEANQFAVSDSALDEQRAVHIDGKFALYLPLKTVQDTPRLAEIVAQVRRWRIDQQLQHLDGLTGVEIKCTAGVESATISHPVDAARGEPKIACPTVIVDEEKRAAFHREASKSMEREALRDAVAEQSFRDAVDYPVDDSAKAEKAADAA